MDNFNANNLAVDNGNMFGLPHNYPQSELVIYPVAWDTTVSYADGTSGAPERIREESLQVDLYDYDYGNFWEKGIYYAEPNAEISQKNKYLRALAKEAIRLQQEGETPEKNATLQKDLEKVNSGCRDMITTVRRDTQQLLADGKKVVLLGGDHSTPLGYLQALDDAGTPFGILQIDAHCDLRESYEYFEYSHASIMYNALKLNCVENLTQVGIRDFCEEESNFAKNAPKPVHTFYDRDMKYRMIEGVTWAQICTQIVLTLPQNVYISFDIDGLEGWYCPKTGTPVSGGLTPEQVFYLFHLMKASGKKIVGIDLNEVGDDVWDANVGARILYRLCGLWLC